MKLAQKFKFFINVIILFSFTGNSFSQTGNLDLLVWEPKSQFVLMETEVITPRYPVIDFHNHGDSCLEDAEKYPEEMDKARVWKVESLDGCSAENFHKKYLEVSHKVAADRFFGFFRPDLSGIGEKDYGIKEYNKFEEAVKLEVWGLKIRKSLGIRAKDKYGKVSPLDVPRIDPIWVKSGESSISVVIHISDPFVSHRPIDKYNKRYDELGAHPEWSFYEVGFPYSKNEILDQLYRVIAKHPNTILVSTNVVNLAENLDRVAGWLEQYPNKYIYKDARISESGCQPYTAHKFKIKCQDWVFFETETPLDTEAHQIYYRFLKTDDEYFDPAKPPLTGKMDDLRY